MKLSLLSRCISIEHTRQGYLATYLRSKSMTTVRLFYFIDVNNQSSGKQHRITGQSSAVCQFQMSLCMCCKGGDRIFRPCTRLGSRRLAPISEIRDPESGLLMSVSSKARSSAAGFLLGKSFVLRIDMRFILPENDRHSPFNRHGRPDIHRKKPWSPSGT